MTETATAVAERVWFDTAGAAEYAGVNPSTLWRARQRGELRAGGVGRSVRYERSELDRWLRSGGPEK